MQKDMIRQMQKKFQESMSKMQDELAAQVVEGTSGGGAVKISMNGQQEVQKVSIDPGVVNPEEVDVLEDLLMVAIKDAIAKSQALGASKISQMTGGLNIPGLF